jgi:catalase
MAHLTVASPRTRCGEPFARLGYSCVAGLGPRRSTEHVLFRYDARSVPPITFDSLPHGCTGGAATLDVARKMYRSAMSGLLGVSRRELPPTVEHLEAVVADMWVRTEVGAVHRDPLRDRMFLQTLLSKGPAQDAMQADLKRAATNQGPTPVVVIVEPYEAVGTVLDQIRAADTVLVVHRDTRNVIGWVTIYGPNAEGPEDIERIPSEGELRTRPITFLTDACVTGNRRALRTQSNLVPGIGASPDKMLLGRMFAYGDAHRYRIGANYNQLPVNAPRSPVHSYSKDGQVAVSTGARVGFRQTTAPLEQRGE